MWHFRRLGHPFTASEDGQMSGATLSGNPVAIDASGQAGVTVMANGVAGPYRVTASAGGAPAPASFTLTNVGPDRQPVGDRLRGLRQRRPDRLRREGDRRRHGYAERG